MSILITGAAGFIGYHVAQVLLRLGECVVGVDNLNDYYEVSLKHARLERLRKTSSFVFHKLDLAEPKNVAVLAAACPDVTQIVHMAAQAGVRYSLINPYSYVSSNVMGHVSVLELARCFDRLRNMVYASSSSVYGGNEKVPFKETDSVEMPQSLYAATKRADELISYTYSHLYGLPLVGLRLFTVYGPFGRPDMAPMKFTRAILARQPIRVFNNGEMWRDFTYIDDIVAGVLAALECPPTGKPPHKLYNLGNRRSEKLTDFIAALERALGKKAEIHFEPMQPGDVQTTCADIEEAQQDLGFEPATSMTEGVAKFANWYREFYDA